MVALYPEVEPCDHGLLDVGDANLVYWEACGNPLGKPALVLHGGPARDVLRGGDGTSTRVSTGSSCSTSEVAAEAPPTPGIRLLT